MNTRTLKLWLMVLVFAVLLAATAAAGGQTEGGAEEVTLEFWMPGQEPTIRSTMTGLIEKYIAENPGVKINYTQTPWSDWFTKLSAAIAGNLVPDISGVGFGQFGMLATKDTFAEMPGGTNYDPDVQQWARQAGQYKGKQYAIFLPETRPLAFRIDWFREVGLDPDDPPGNWAELRQYAEKLAKREGGKVTRAGIDIPYLAGNEQIFLTFYAQKKKGAHLWEEGGRPIFYDDAGVATLEYLVDLKVKYNVLIPSDQQSLMGTAFEQGAAAMGFPKSQGLPALIKSKPGAIGFAHPTKEAEDKALTLGSFIAVYKKAKNPQEAFKFQEFLNSKDSMWAIYEGILFLPTRDSLKDRFIADQPYNEILAHCMMNSVFYNINPSFGEARTALYTEITEAFLQNKTPDQALKDANDKLMEIWKKSQ